MPLNFICNVNVMGNCKVAQASTSFLLFKFSENRFPYLFFTFIYINPTIVTYNIPVHKFNGKSFYSVVFRISIISHIYFLASYIVFKILGHTDGKFISKLDHRLVFFFLYNLQITFNK